MPRAALVAVALFLAACSAEDESNFPDPSGLYRIEADGPVCDGGSVAYPDAETATCTRECLDVDGRDVRRVDLTFRRELDAPWRLAFAAWDFGVCD